MKNTGAGRNKKKKTIKERMLYYFDIWLSNNGAIGFCYCIACSDVWRQGFARKFSVGYYEPCL